MALVNGSTGAVAACYEYSPYGEFLRCETTDPVVADQPFRFSTKFYDGETGLIDFGHRFYSPSQGRFLGRDPIEEQGGLNLYGFCGNDGINQWDYLGNIPGWVKAIVNWLGFGGSDSSDIGADGPYITQIGNQIPSDRDASHDPIIISGSNPINLTPVNDIPIVMSPFVVSASKINAPAFGPFLSGPPTLGDTISTATDGAQIGAANFGAGLAQAGVGLITGPIDLVRDPVTTVTNTATTVVNLTGLLTTPLGQIQLVTNIGDATNAAFNTLQGAAAVSQGIGNLTGLVLIGAATSNIGKGSYMGPGSPDFVGPVAPRPNLGSLRPLDGTIVNSTSMHDFKYDLLGNRAPVKFWDAKVDDQGFVWLVRKNGSTPPINTGLQPGDLPGLYPKGGG